jgi:HEPN domain-containing protein
MLNLQKARDWLHMALKEFEAANRDFLAGRNSESIQHSQQSAERVCKSILSYLGFVLKKLIIHLIILSMNSLKNLILFKFQGSQGMM